MSIVQSIAELERIYGAPGETSLVKVADRVTPEYRAYIERSPFVILATSGPEGLDCSPRGDARSAVEVAGPRRLLLPDRRGNNRIDSLRNVVRDPRVALLFLLPGSGNTVRVNGRAVISIEPQLLAALAVEGKAPRSVLDIAVEEVYFQCARAIVRSGLWTPGNWPDLNDLPTPGDILAALSDNKVGGERYDREWPERAKNSLW